MPTLDDLLQQTMLFTAARGMNKKPQPLSTGRKFTSPEPIYRTFAEIEVDPLILDRPAAKREAAEHNAIWKLSWDPAHPNTFEKVTCRTRGMGMDYGMPARVLDKVEFRECRIIRLNDEAHDLILSPANMLGAWWRKAGRVTGGERMWPLRSQVDASVMVAFGFQLTDDGIKPLSLGEAEEYGDELMPAEGFLGSYRFTAGDDPAHHVCVGPCRYIVAVELVLAKEKPDFVPGDIVSFARIGSHGFVWSNELLKSVELSIVLQRPSGGMTCDAGMKQKIGLLVVSDTNDRHDPGAKVGMPPLPFTDNLYDYYETEPKARFGKRRKMAGDEPRQKDGEITLAERRQKTERFIESAVTRSTMVLRNDRDIRKCKRQGQFDNVHMAARMQAAHPEKHSTLDNIVMINQCVHDCVHMHVRWGEPLEEQMMTGFGPAGPYTKPGAPQVPANQTVFVSFPDGPGTAMKYRAIADDPRVGEPQIFCHHGLAYAIDRFPSGLGSRNYDFMMAGVEIAAGENPFRLDFYDDWGKFYWLVRYYVDDNGRVHQRLKFPNLDKCMR